MRKEKNGWLNLLLIQEFWFLRRDYRTLILTSENYPSLSISDIKRSLILNCYENSDRKIKWTENFYTLDTTQHSFKLNLIIRQSATEKKLPVVRFREKSFLRFVNGCARDGEMLWCWLWRERKFGVKYSEGAKSFLNTNTRKLSMKREMLKVTKEKFIDILRFARK